MHANTYTPFVYWIFLPDGKMYIGSRTAKNTSPKELMTKYFTSSKLLKAKLKSGELKPVHIVIVPYRTKEEAVESESKLLKYFGVMENGAFVNQYANDGKFTTAGKTHTAETCAKISAGNRGKTITPETCAKMSAANRGTKRPPRTVEHCAKLSASLSGRTLTPEHCAKMSAAMSGEKNPFFGKTHTPESCEKISASHRGEKNPNFGKTRTPEHCEKISASQQGTLTALDLELQDFRKISKEEYHSGKGVRYFNTNSKVAREFKKNRNKKNGYSKIGYKII